MNPIFKHGPSPQHRLVLVLFCSALLIFFDHKANSFESVRGYLQSMVSPLQYLATTPKQAIDWAVENMVTRRQLIEENQAFKTNELRYQEQLMQLSMLKKENDRLRSLLASPVRADAKKMVAENFNKFYNYLLSKNYKSSKDLVPFIIDIFRQFRNLTFEKSNPVQALNLLFGLLTSLEDDINNINTEKWGLENIDIPNGFDDYIQQIQNGFSNVKPKLDLIIRHSAGILFQEAQKEVLFFNPNFEMPVTLPKIFPVASFALLSPSPALPIHL